MVAVAGQRADGYDEGLENGIRIFIEDNQDEGISAQRIIEKLQKRFNLTASEAGDHLNRYSGNGGTL